MMSPSVEDMAKPIKCLKNNQAPGENDLKSDIYKQAADFIRLRADFQGSVRKGKLADRLERSNPAAILQQLSLTVVAAKTITALLFKKFQAQRDQRTRPSRIGFPAGRGYIGRIFNL